MLLTSFAREPARRLAVISLQFPCDVTYQSHHDFAEKHVFEGAESSRVTLIDLRKAFERLKEIRVGCLVILFVGVDRSSLKVKLCLQIRWTVDRVRRGACRSESCLSRKNIAWVRELALALGRF